jgi:hypothetical protein
MTLEKENEFKRLANMIEYAEQNGDFERAMELTKEMIQLIQTR